MKPGNKMKICTFMWIYYGYPSSSYEGIGVEEMRYRCGAMLARRDKGTIQVDTVAGVPDSGTAHAIGYANESGIPLPPVYQIYPDLAALFYAKHPEPAQPDCTHEADCSAGADWGKSLLLIDDSIVRGTQLRETGEFLYASGAKEDHVRPACPPLFYGCKYLNFSRSRSDMDLITRRVMMELENQITPELLNRYTDPNAGSRRILDVICHKLNVTSLRYHRLDDIIESVGLPREQLCTYCWDGKED